MRRFYHGETPIFRARFRPGDLPTMTDHLVGSRHRNLGGIFDAVKASHNVLFPMSASYQDQVCSLFNFDGGVDMILADSRTTGVGR